MQQIEVVTEAIELGEDESAIVFFRDTMLGGGVQAPVAEVKEGNEVSFIAIISYYSKLLHRTTPGKHLYVVGGESSTLLEAELAPGKYYYVRVDPDMGFMKARFHLEAIDVSELPTLQKAMKPCKWVKAGETAQEWFAENKESMQEKAVSAVKKHQDEKTRNKYFLKADQGVDKLLEEAK
jgi:hypothetical protein